MRSDTRWAGHGVVSKGRGTLAVAAERVLGPDTGSRWAAAAEGRVRRRQKFRGSDSSLVLNGDHRSRGESGLSEAQGGFPACGRKADGTLGK